MIRTRVNLSREQLDRRPDNERPVHLVTLEAYWIDRYPVTCGQYRAL